MNVLELHLEKHPPPPCSIASTRPPGSSAPTPAASHICHALVSTPPGPRPPVLHSCQAATCSLQHAAQLLCYNNKLRSAAAGRSHYLQLLLYPEQGDASDPNFRVGSNQPPTHPQNTASCSTVYCKCAG